MRVVIAEVQDYGYLGMNSNGISETLVFGNPSLAEQWIDNTYSEKERLPDLKLGGQNVHTYRCVTKRQEIHYVQLLDKEIITKLES